MNAFNDTAGRRWTVAVDFPTTLRVKGETGVDLLDLEKGWPQLGELPILAEVGWSLVEKQASSQGVTREEFWTALDGDAFEGLLAAVVGAATDFFPKEKREKISMLMDRCQVATEKKMDELTPEKVDQIIEEVTRS